MDALKQSPMALNVQCAPFVKAVQKVGSGASSHRPPFKSSLIRIGLSRTPNPLASKVPLVGSGHRAHVVMADTTAGSYAEALAELAQSTKSLDIVNNDIDKLSRFIAYKEFYSFLANPIIKEEKKKSIIKAIADDAKFQPSTLNFLYLLIDNKRMDLIGDIVKEFELAYNKLTDTQLAVVTSVVNLENRHLAEIAKKVQSLTGAKNVRLKTVIDPSLIAGFTIRYGPTGSNIIDMSVKTELEKLASQIGYKERIENV
jgi:F-type H+-transporting ATPase subunit delta